MNELWYGLVSGLTIGAVGSFHCLGMCGPIALSLPFASTSKTQVGLSMALYHLGRAITYGCLGILFGLLGSPVPDLGNTTSHFYSRRSPVTIICSFSF
jgi:sulfite exporter TauE/SafE